MADQAAPQAPQAPQTEPTVVVQLQEGVKTVIAAAQANGDIKNRVIAALAEEEIAKRAQILTAGLAAFKAATAELRKIKPDQKAYDADGKVAAETYSEANVKKLREARERVAKIEKAIAAAVNDANYDELKKFADSKPGKEEAAQ